MTIKKKSIAGLLLGFLSLQTIATDQQKHNTQTLETPQYSNSLLFEHAHALNELSSRRRVNTFFPNEQPWRGW